MIEYTITIAIALAFLLINRNPFFDALRSIAGFACLAIGLILIVSGSILLFELTGDDKISTLSMISIGVLFLWCCGRLWGLWAPDTGRYRKAVRPVKNPTHKPGISDHFKK